MSEPNQGKTGLSAWQKDKIDKIINNTPKKAWNNPETLEKIFSVALNTLDTNKINPKPNLSFRKRKGSNHEQDMEMDEQTNDAGPSEKPAWRLAKKTCKLNKSQDSINTNESETLLQDNGNIYEHLLSTQEDENGEINIQNTQPRNNNKPPPIYGTGTNMKKVIELFSIGEITKNKFHLKQQKEENIIIFAHDYTTYDTIKDILVKNNVQFFTYTPKNRRPKSLILKGIRGEPEAEDIKNEINSMNLNKLKLLK
ncbi:hypothetical protein PV328_012209 [Microctonus aethiopoides]|uniref:Uncharacterized protein n=1 Tax=Microctonus aethiopoides TaxID=144406 RepID=A0AA39KPV5_9HYME|nr:hypothetical protein PV328_012209 [Microctonus aethiopoides]